MQRKKIPSMNSKIWHPLDNAVEYMENDVPVMIISIDLKKLLNVNIKENCFNF